MIFPLKTCTHRIARLTLTILAIASIALSTVSHADSFVWKVSKGENQLFLGGTVHMLSSSDFPLPVEFDEAYGQATTVVFETDITAAFAPEFEQVVMDKMMYTDGTTLESQLAPETWEKLSSYLEQYYLPPAFANSMKPGMMYSLLWVFELERMGIDQAGVDEFYNDKAIADSKTLVALETPEEQLDYIAALGANNPDELILSTLDDIAKLPEIMDALIKAWREGDEPTMSAMMIAEIETRYPDLYQSLLVERNQNWFPRIVAMLDTPDVEVVLVGAAHLAGKDGLLRMLAAQGFKVELL